jgi:cytochrome c biogenesis factor
MIILVAICAACLIALVFPGLLSALIGIPVLLAMIWYGGIFGWIMAACLVLVTVGVVIDDIEKHKKIG